MKKKTYNKGNKNSELFTKSKYGNIEITTLNGAAFDRIFGSASDSFEKFEEGFKTLTEEERETIVEMAKAIFPGLRALGL